MTAGVGCHAGRYSLLAGLAALEPKKGLTGDVHSQITRRIPAFTAGLPLPGIAIDGASGKTDGAIAQLGERLLCKQEVVGSIPSGSTIPIPSIALKTSLRPSPPESCFFVLL